MRVCVIALDDPWAADHGGTQRTRLLVAALEAAGHDTAVAYVSGSGTVPDLGRVTVRAVSKRPLGERPGIRRLGPLKRWLFPLPTMRGGMIPELAAAVTDLAPAVVIVTQLRAAPYVNASPGAHLWLDQSDLWSTFLRAELSHRRRFARAVGSVQLRLVEKAEREWVARAGALSAAGYHDAESLRTMSGRDVVWLPPATPPQRIDRTSGGQRTAGLLANFHYWPNVDAFLHLRDHWSAPLREKGWRIIVAGLGSETLDTKGLVENIGRVDDIRDFYSGVDLCLAPIRLGGGIKVKIIEALMFKRPVVATRYALEGFSPEFARAIPTVSGDQPDFSFLDRPVDASRAYDLAVRCFSPSVWDRKVANLVQTLVPPPN